jgi:hypothetical protein
MSAGMFIFSEMNTDCVLSSVFLPVSLDTARLRLFRWSFNDLLWCLAVIAVS